MAKEAWFVIAILLAFIVLGNLAVNTGPSVEVIKVKVISAKETCFKTCFQELWFDDAGYDRRVINETATRYATGDMIDVQRKEGPRIFLPGRHGSSINKNNYSYRLYSNEADAATKAAPSSNQK